MHEHRSASAPEALCKTGQEGEADARGSCPVMNVPAAPFRLPLSGCPPSGCPRLPDPHLPAPRPAAPEARASPAQLRRVTPMNYNGSATPFPPPVLTLGRGWLGPTPPPTLALGPGFRKGCLFRRSVGIPGWLCQCRASLIPGEIRATRAFGACAERGFEP